MINRLFCASFLALALACDTSPPDPSPAAVEPQGLGIGCSCSLPVGGLYATFKVGAESYNQHITNPEAINDAIALWRGKSNKRIPIGALQCGCQGWNCGWHFSVDPTTIQFAAVTIELCDGTPSYVDAHCASFGSSYCPWGAKLVELRDCRGSARCPPVPRF
jgi:hypothetical protein